MEATGGNSVLLRDTKLAADGERLLLEELELAVEERGDDVHHALTAVAGVGVLALPTVDVLGELIKE